jgi:hypothetical protein
MAETRAVRLLRVTAPNPDAQASIIGGGKEPAAAAKAATTSVRGSASGTMPVGLALSVAIVRETEASEASLTCSGNVGTVLR